ncbi:hypothetical protein H7097_00280 [Aeromicrobium sp.]|nr:hypothetical protein [Candidatus Saccharibacteria bacterium]
MPGPLAAETSPATVMAGHAASSEVLTAVPAELRIDGINDKESRDLSEIARQINVAETGTNRAMHSQEFVGTVEQARKLCPYLGSRSLEEAAKAVQKQADEKAELNSIMDLFEMSGLDDHSTASKAKSKDEARVGSNKSSEKSARVSVVDTEILKVVHTIPGVLLHPVVRPLPLSAEKAPKLQKNDEVVLPANVETILSENSAEISVTNTSIQNVSESKRVLREQLTERFDDDTNLASLSPDVGAVNLPTLKLIKEDSTQHKIKPAYVQKLESVIGARTHSKAAEHFLRYIPAPESDNIEISVPSTFDRTVAGTKDTSDSEHRLESVEGLADAWLDLAAEQTAMSELNTADVTVEPEDANELLSTDRNADNVSGNSKIIEGDLQEMAFANEENYIAPAESKSITTLAGIEMTTKANESDSFTIEVSDAINRFIDQLAVDFDAETTIELVEHDVVAIEQVLLEVSESEISIDAVTIREALVHAAFALKVTTDPEMAATFRELLDAHDLVAVLELLHAEFNPNTEYLSKRLGTSEIICKMQQVLVSIQAAANRACGIGRSALQLYGSQVEFAPGAAYID